MSSGARLRGLRSTTTESGSGSSISHVHVRQDDTTTAAAVSAGALSAVRAFLRRRPRTALLIGVLLVWMTFWTLVGHHGYDGEDDDEVTQASMSFSPGEDLTLQVDRLTKQGAQDVANSEQIRSYIRFAADHPIHASDRLAFAQMGYQTAMYARILRDQQHERQVEADVLTQFEKELWTFAPGLQRIRALHGLHAQGEKGDALRTRHQRWLKVGRKILSKAVKPLHGGRKNREGDERVPISSSRGLIMTVGNGQFPYAAQLIATIREAHQCDIPIEVYYHGETDLHVDAREFLERSYWDVTTIDLSTLNLFDDDLCGLHDSGWAMKPYALLATNFTEAILIDADGVLLADPHDFFLEAGYRATGTLFFHDRLLPDWHNNETIDFVRLQLGRRGPMDALAQSPYMQRNLSHHQESGLVLVNKAVPDVLAALLLTAWQNAKPVRDAVTYLKFHGDKETFWFAHELARLPYHFSRYWAGAIGPEHAAHRQGFCADHQLHFFDAPRAHPSSDSSDASAATDGRPAWFNGSLRKNKLHGDYDEVLDVDDSIWAMDGDWEFVTWDGQSSFCLRNYTRNSMNDLALGQTLQDIMRAGERASREVWRFYESSREAPKTA